MCPAPRILRMRMYNSNCSSRSQRLDFFEKWNYISLSTITCFCSTKIGHWLHQGITPITLQRHFLRNYHHRSPVFPSVSPSSYHIPAPYLTEVSKIWLSWPAKFFDPWKKKLELTFYLRGNQFSKRPVISHVTRPKNWGLSELPKEIKGKKWKRCRKQS